MAKIRHPRKFSLHFGIDRSAFNKTGALDPVMNADTRLFIDPLLLAKSSTEELRLGASHELREHFALVIKLLRASSRPGDVAWKAARDLMTYREVSWTCLGYGAASTRGSGFGPGLREAVQATAKEIVDLGVTDPDLFVLLPLLSEKIGPDLISDMTTNIIAGSLAAYTVRVLKPFRFERRAFPIGRASFELPENPCNPGSPVLLVPNDVLSKLPVASSWSEVAHIAFQNAGYRKRVNELIGQIWMERTRKDREALRQRVLASASTVGGVIDLLRSVPLSPYDVKKDPDGVLVWQAFMEEVAAQHPFRIAKPKSLSAAAVVEVVRAITQQFKHIVEDRGVARLLWREPGVPHVERVAQMLYFVVADSYCKANDLDITPEADTYTGVIDFKFSQGYESRVVVEIKLSRNNKLLSGYTKQLELYKRAERSNHGMYVIIDVGSMGRKYQQVLKAKAAAEKLGAASEVVLIDGAVRLSASKR